MDIRKVVIPVAGAGTRLLPVTKCQPKEMLPVGRKPAVQYVVEEAEAAGLKQVLFVTGRQKTAIEDHFDKDPDLARRLRVPDLVARCLWIRGHRSQPEAATFLQPRLADLRGPDGLPDVDRADVGSR